MFLSALDYFSLYNYVLFIWQNMEQGIILLQILK